MKKEGRKTKRNEREKEKRKGERELNRKYKLNIIQCSSLILPEQKHEVCILRPLVHYTSINDEQDYLCRE